MPLVLIEIYILILSILFIKHQAGFKQDILRKICKKKFHDDNLRGLKLRFINNGYPKKTCWNRLINVSDSAPTAYINKTRIDPPVPYYRISAIKHLSRSMMNVFKEFRTLKIVEEDNKHFFLEMTYINDRKNCLNLMSDIYNLIRNYLL